MAQEEGFGCLNRVAISVITGKGEHKIYRVTMKWFYQPNELNYLINTENHILCFLFSKANKCS